LLYSTGDTSARRAPGTAIAFKMISPAHRLNSNSPSSHRTPH
jgi:hypothetical protein